jgi:hypothetical protein
MPSDDILDLLGRYASGSLSSEERKRLFDAALDDQDLFDQVAREADLKALLDQPGVRNRMIHALEPPRRKRAWIFGAAGAVAASVAFLAFLLRPAPKPAEVSVAKVATPEIVPQPAPVAKAQPPVPVAKEKMAPLKKKEIALAQPVNQPAKDANRDLDQVTVASAPAPPPPAAAPPPVRAQPQQNAVGGVGQLATQARGAFSGFHYSVQTPGRLSIIPATDGFVFVKSADGAILFGPKNSAAGIILDIPVPDAVHSVVITFSSTADPVKTNPIAHSEPEANLSGNGPLAISVAIP